MNLSHTSKRADFLNRPAFLFPREHTLFGIIMASAQRFDVSDEVDELVSQYNGDIRLALDELEIDPTAAIPLANLYAKVISTIIGQAKEENRLDQFIIQENVFHVIQWDTPPIYTDPKGLNQFLVICWLDGLLNKLLEQEVAGRSWYRIEKKTFQVSLKAIANDVFNKAISSRSSLQAKSRVVDLMFDFRKLPRPNGMPSMNNLDRAYIYGGVAVWSAGWKIAAKITVR